MIAPILAPVIISAAITSVYAVIAPWIPVTVVPTSLATVAMETFITEVSSVIRNCPIARVSRTTEAAFVLVGVAAAAVVKRALPPAPRQAFAGDRPGGPGASRARSR